MLCSNMQPENGFSHAQLQPGFTVYGSVQNKVGTIREVRNGGLLVSDGGFRDDSLIPLAAVQSASGDRVMLSGPANQAEKQ